MNSFMVCTQVDIQWLLHFSKLKLTDAKNRASHLLGDLCVDAPPIRAVFWNIYSEPLEYCMPPLTHLFPVKHWLCLRPNWKALKFSQVYPRCKCNLFWLGSTSIDTKHNWPAHIKNMFFSNRQCEMALTKLDTFHYKTFNRYKDNCEMSDRSLILHKLFKAWNGLSEGKCFHYNWMQSSFKIQTRRKSNYLSLWL